MNAVDTNVLIYIHDNREPVKQAISEDLVGQLERGVLLWQVACEYLAAARKLVPQGYTPEAARKYVEDLRHIWTTAIPTWDVFDRSADIASRYSLSVWDCLLITACLEAGADTLYSEDFNGYAEIDGLKIVNPFAQAANSSE
jgi:predicted nucleic acid-binding protein